MTIDTIHVYPGSLAKFLAPLVDALPGREVVFVEDLPAALPDIEVLVHFTREPFDWAPATKLRLIQVGGAGVDGLLPAEGLADSVIITNASGSHEPEMPEFAIAMMFALAYNVPTYVEQQRSKVWRPKVPRPIVGSTMCVVGMGTIGESIGRRAAALGMTVTGVRRSGEPIDGVSRMATMEQRIDAIAGADVLVVVAPLTDETRGLIGAAELAALAPNAIVVDVSRGGVTDIDAVVAALESGHLAGAAVDVFEPEPLPDNSPLWEVPNLLVTPHTAGNSRNYVSRWAETLADNLVALEEGQPLTNVIDRDRGY
ncbi:MAG: D-2-hydroxyacid dehydrogenase [Acidimicrobiales bacterium]